MKIEPEELFLTQGHKSYCSIMCRKCLIIIGYREMDITWEPSATRVKNYLCSNCVKNKPRTLSQLANAIESRYKRKK